MTLQKQKKKMPTVRQQKRTGQHHKRTRGYHTPYWPYLPMVAIIGLSFFANSWLARPSSGVLGYATDMSVQSLLDDTNQQRVANGESNLSLNTQLDQAAQAKADDMAARDYWSHNTPDGQTPWTFITTAGYSYHTAGENLAYGFTTAADTLTGWMNSAGHRANILNTSFVDVGFGIANSPNYQGTGPETIVVAMYASPAVGTPPAPAPVKATPVAPTPVADTPVPAATPPAPTTPVTQDSASGQSGGASAKTKASEVPATTKPTTVPAPEPQQQRMSRIQMVAGIGAGSAVMILAFVVSTLFIVRHSRAWHKAIKKGEQLVLHHPVWDIAAVAIVAMCVLLSQTSGLIR